MTKQNYIEEMLSEALPYNITVDQIKALAKDIIDGLDAWYEMSGDSVASSNRYGHLEREKEEAVKKKQKEMEKIEKTHQEYIEESNRRYVRMRQIYQNRIEELEKKVK